MDNNLTWHTSSITKTQRAKLKNQKPCVLWFTGLSGSGKSTLANAVEKKLFEQGFHTYLLDGDNIRHGLNGDLGFDEVSRVENIRRIGELCKLFMDAGMIVLCAFISPFEKDRKLVKDLLEEDEYIEIFVDTSLEVCEKRDPKGLYKKARQGEIKNFTGVDSPYERPKNPHIYITKEDLNENVDMILGFLNKKI
ncbi:TPA: adenylyl-sulfate kinase [Campylobacter coli]|uniref:adenylyl-sulfate kinase n=1 Tax=Campylobacter coli TaxID=195 RepID=UPI001DE68ECF|nr:adenylyl-sulfate kinase [Campylobacter coli]EFS3719657.1 adenylyl-sulfate kinase [Campylobacter coli]EHQ5398890.1 adenylyl-sulfate kinase [Campylobacter coli]MDK2074724.1 adenylyl-sulfate kinase [Campylobacter coli]HEF3452813.1 adenylyl-sulfate kinase [Campylobacter coli]HEF3454600.1 adenylyl-sulfate kinase [Campylobacter coli]